MTPENNFMTKYIKSVIVAALLLGGASIAQADHHGGHSKTNRVDKTKAKPAAKRAAPSEAKKRYAAAAKKIKEGVKAGKLTEKQAKEKLGALKKRARGPSRRPSREDLVKKFDKNKDGKLDDKERAAARKGMAERRKKASAERTPKEGEKKAESRKRGRRPGSDRSGVSRRGGRGKRPQ
jgi:hypothetical protein